jgi:NDP-mannose synthase
MKAVILAGGRGTRLAPYTSILPKPLMPVGERAVLEIVVDQLRSRGFADITFCVGYLSHLIQAVFNHGRDRGVKISYVQERKPLGTAAPLRLVEGLDSTFLAMNGDVLTTLDYCDLVRHHRESGDTLTIAAQERRIKHDYGVLHLDTAQPNQSRVRFYEEKPELVSLVSMGVYVMEPEVLDFIPPDRSFDFPDLVQELLGADRPVGAYSSDGFWLDLGRQEDYETAIEWLRNGHSLTSDRDLIADLVPSLSAEEHQRAR